MTKEERRKRREMWHERVTAFRASGLSVAAWCREHELKEHQMRYWLRRFQSVSEPDSSAATWLPVHVRDDRESQGVGELVVRVGDVAIEVRPGFDRSLLVELVETLTDRC